MESKQKNRLLGFTAIIVITALLALPALAAQGGGAISDYTKSAIEHGMSGGVGTPIAADNVKTEEADVKSGAVTPDNISAMEVTQIKDEDMLKYGIDPAAKEPALSIAVSTMRAMTEYKKSAVINSDITFTADEFEKFLGIKKIPGITVTKLPPVTEGVLVLGKSDVIAGQKISRDNIKYLRLIPYPDKLGNIKFCFKNISDAKMGASYICNVAVLASLNFAPTAASAQVSTQKNIAVWDMLAGVDPDNDSIAYKVLKAPEKGLLRINADGTYMYTPKSGFTGSDNFVFQTEDIYGNRSNEAVIQIKVTKASSDIKFTDMAEHWAANSAVRAYAAGIISADKSDPNVKFQPEVLVSRAEFLEMIMRTAKLDKDLEETFDTGFSDDGEIPLKYKPYVKRAKQLGIISGASSGTPGDTAVYFQPNTVITRSEAAVMVNNILKVPANSISFSSASAKYVDAVAIPDWAESDIYALSSIGIIRGDEKGNIDPYGLLDRAQSAQLLCGVMDYTAKEKKPFNLLNLIFG